MTHPVAHAITKAAPQYSVSPVATDSFLPLIGDGPFTVNVKVSNDGTVEFALPTSPSVSYTDGVIWTRTGTKPVPTSTQITFVFVLNTGGPTITSLASSTTGLTFGRVTSSQQTGTVDTVNTTSPYDFTINNSSSATPNAQIVVTPIGGSGGDGD